MSMYFPTTTIKGTFLFSSQCMRENIFSLTWTVPNICVLHPTTGRLIFNYHWQMSDAKERLFGSWDRYEGNKPRQLCNFTGYLMQCYLFTQRQIQCRLQNPSILSRLYRFTASHQQLHKVSLHQHGKLCCAERSLSLHSRVVPLGCGSLRHSEMT